MIVTNIETKENYEVEFKNNKGQEYKPCPECSETRKKKKDPCLSWDHDKGVGMCHHCESRFALPKKREEPKKKEKPEPLPKLNNTELSDKTFEYFKSRGISTTTIKRNKITEGLKYMPQANEKRNCIMFNYFVNGEHVNTKFRDGKKNFTQLKGAEKYFYGLDDVKGADEVIIVEGEFDKLAWEEAGFKNCISVPDGALKSSQTYSQKKLEYIANSYDFLEGKERIYLATDNDEPGRALREELARRLGRHRCFIIDFEGFKDSNEVLVGEGVEKLTQLKESAFEYPIEGVVTFDQIGEDIENLYENGISKEATTGFSDFDRHASFNGGWLTLITGIPGHGKSSFMDQLVVLLAEKGWKFGYYSPEHDLTMQFQRLARILMGKQFFGGSNQMSKEDLNFAIEYLSDKIYNVRPKNEDQTIENILEISKSLIARKGINFLIIDPWNAIDHNHESEQKFAKDALTKLNIFKIQYGVHVCVIAHPRKMRKREDGQYEIPNAYDVADSAHFYNKTDQILSVYRSGLDDTTTVQIQKCKFEGILGKKGYVKFVHQDQSGRFIEDMQNVYPGGVIKVEESKVQSEELEDIEPPF